MIKVITALDEMRSSSKAVKKSIKDAKLGVINVDSESLEEELRDLECEEKAMGDLEKKIFERNTLLSDQILGVEKRQRHLEEEEARRLRLKEEEKKEREKEKEQEKAAFLVGLQTPKDDEYISKAHLGLDACKPADELMKDLLDIKKTTKLPYLFFWDYDIYRFKLDSENRFDFSGRSSSKAIFQKVEEALKNHIKFHIIYGSIGYGKSFMLAAFAVYLLKKGERVLYLPKAKCIFMRKNWYRALKMLKATEERRTDKNNTLIEDIARLIRAIPKESNKERFALYTKDVINTLDSVIFIIDQWNSIPSFKMAQEIADQVSCSSNILITAASANNKTSAKVFLSETRSNEFTFEGKFGGYGDDEFNEWKERNKDALENIENIDFEELRDLTGMVPFYLDEFLRCSKDNYEDSIQEMYNSSIVMKMRTQISEFVELHIDKPQYTKLAIACVLEQQAVKIKDELVDQRHFYFIRDKCYCTCGFARQILTDEILACLEKFKLTYKDALYRIETALNPASRSFYAEFSFKIKLQTEGIASFKIPRPDVVRKIYTIRDIAGVDPEPCTVYNPVRFYFRKFDAAVRKGNTMYLFQVTTSGRWEDYVSGCCQHIEANLPELSGCTFVFCWVTIDRFTLPSTAAKDKLLFRKPIKIMHLKLDQGIQNFGDINEKVDAIEAKERAALEKTALDSENPSGKTLGAEEQADSALKRIKKRMQKQVENAGSQSKKQETVRNAKGQTKKPRTIKSADSVNKSLSTTSSTKGKVNEVTELAEKDSKIKKTKK